MITPLKKGMLETDDYLKRSYKDDNFRLDSRERDIREFNYMKQNQNEQNNFE
jgi:hypothetical protein